MQWKINFQIHTILVEQRRWKSNVQNFKIKKKKNFLSRNNSWWLWTQNRQWWFVTVFFQIFWLFYSVFLFFKYFLYIFSLFLYIFYMFFYIIFHYFFKFYIIFFLKYKILLVPSKCTPKDDIPIVFIWSLNSRKKHSTIYWLQSD